MNGACYRVVAGLLSVSWVALFPMAFAGQKIQFSDPKSKHELPSETPDYSRAPIAPKSFSSPSVQPIMPMAPPVERTPPARRDEKTQRHWLLDEPPLFSDKFDQPKLLKSDSTDPLLRNAATDRFFGTKNDEERDSRNSALAPWLYRMNMMDERERRLQEDDIPALFQANKESAVREREETSLKSLFGSQENTKTETPSGLRSMSVTDLLQDLLKANARAATEQNDRDKANDFQKLLNPVPASPRLAPGLLDPINSPKDLTQTPLNPVTGFTTPSSFLPTPRSDSFLGVVPHPVDVGAPLGALRTDNRPGYLFPLQPTPAPPRSVSPQQNLMNRPTVHDFPARRF